MSHGAAIGFDRTMSIRGDLVSAGLPSSLLKPRRPWVEEAVPASRQMRSETWVPVRLEPPIRHFACERGVAGPYALLASLAMTGRPRAASLAAMIAGALLQMIAKRTDTLIVPILRLRNRVAALVDH
jgi:hypothetical protein